MRDAARSWSTQIVARTEEITQAGSETPEPPQSTVPFWRSSRAREHEKTCTNLLFSWTGLGQRAHGRKRLELWVLFGMTAALPPDR